MAEIGALMGNASSPASAGRSAFSELKAEEFVKIIFTELANQDPLQPNDSKALLEQLASIRSIQSDVDLGQRLGTLVGQNELAAASNLIGRTVRGRTGAGLEATGVVRSVLRTSTGAELNLASGHRVPMSRVSEVLEPPAAAGATP